MTSACSRVAAPSFRRAVRKCSATVTAVMPSVLAMAAQASPRPSHSRHSTSRRVSGCCAPSVMEETYIGTGPFRHASAATLRRRPRARRWVGKDAEGDGTAVIRRFMDRSRTAMPGCHTVEGASLRLQNERRARPQPGWAEGARKVGQILRLRLRSWGFRNRPIGLSDGFSSGGVQMSRQEAKVRVLIPTTADLLDVLLLTEEDPAIGRSVACIGGSTRMAGIDADYNALLHPRNGRRRTPVRPPLLSSRRLGPDRCRLQLAAGRPDRPRPSRCGAAGWRRRARRSASCRPPAAYAQST